MKEEALKLADELDRMVLSDDWGDMAKYYEWFRENASPTIRQLVAELDNLEKSNDLFRKNDAFLRKQFQDQNKRIAELDKQSEPVAWMIVQDGKNFYADKFEVMQPNEFDKCFPLYTAPQTKPLSNIDEQIKALQAIGGYWYDGQIRNVEIANTCHQLTKLISQCAERHGIK